MKYVHFGVLILCGRSLFGSKNFSAPSKSYLGLELYDELTPLWMDVSAISSADNLFLQVRSCFGWVPESHREIPSTLEVPGHGEHPHHSQPIIRSGDMEASLDTLFHFPIDFKESFNWFICSSNPYLWEFVSFWTQVLNLLLSMHTLILTAEFILRSACISPSPWGLKGAFPDFSSR